MADSSAERQRRFRRHKAGDHSLCAPGRCPALAGAEPAAVTPEPVTQPVTRNAPAPAEPVTRDTAPRWNPARYPAPDLAPAGRELWHELMAVPRTPGEVALIAEVCRLKDRADQLDALLRGDHIEWARVTIRDDGDDDRTYVLVVDNAISQARMHATTLRMLVTELRMSGGASVAEPGAALASTGQGDGIDELGQRRARRIAASTGS